MSQSKTNPMVKNRHHRQSAITPSRELREHALQVSHIGQEILENSVQKRLDDKTIVLMRKKPQQE